MKGRKRRRDEAVARMDEMLAELELRAMRPGRGEMIPIDGQVPRRLASRVRLGNS